jgi:hypothetical protein
MAGHSGTSSGPLLLQFSHLRLEDIELYCQSFEPHLLPLPSFPRMGPVALASGEKFGVNGVAVGKAMGGGEKPY